MTVIRDPRMQARAEYTEALKEARRKHWELCGLLGITDEEYKEDTLKAWLDGWEFDVASDGKGGSYLCMSRGRLPHNGYLNPEAADFPIIPFEDTPDGQKQ